MDSQPLVEADVELGRAATEALSADADLRLRAAMWWFDENRQQWLFAISTPFYEQKGAQAAYLKVRKILEAKEILQRLPLDRVWIISDYHPALSAMRTVVNPGPGTRFTQCIFNGTLINDVLVYRLDKPEKRRAGTRRKSVAGQ